MNAILRRTIFSKLSVITMQKKSAITNYNQSKWSKPLVNKTLVISIPM